MLNGAENYRTKEGLCNITNSTLEILQQIYHKLNLIPQ